MPPIAMAVFILKQVTEEKQSLTAAIEKARFSDTEHFAQIQEMVYGTMRWWLRLACLLKVLVSKPLKKKDNDIQLLLLVGLYQLLWMRIPPHAAVANTVEATRTLGRPWAAALVNATLRNFLRKKEALLHKLAANDTFKWSHPEWIQKAIAAAWGEQASAILEANNQRPPMTLRVNTRKISVEQYLQLLGETRAHRTAHSPQGIVLKVPCPVERLPLFKEGAVFVQDEAGQLAAPLLNLAPRLRVLDACAAPGGKSLHLLELEPSVRLTCIDQDPKRLKRLAENLKRVGGISTLKAARIQDLEAWWDGQYFDRILLDAPCSATGVIRRHPDIKYLKTAADIPKLAAEQYQLLATLWPLLVPGGILLYTTCSLLPEENHLQLQRFLREHADAQDLAIEAPWGVDVSPGKQILSGMYNMDGFYYGRMRKCVTP